MNLMEHLGNTEFTRTSVFKALLVDLGIIGNIINYNFSGVRALEKKLTVKIDRNLTAGKKNC